MVPPFYFTSLAPWQWLGIGWIIIIGGAYGDFGGVTA